MGIRIDLLNSTVLPSVNHYVPAMNDGLTVKVTFGQIIGLKTATNLTYAASAPSGLTAYTSAKTALDNVGERLIATESNAVRGLGFSFLKNTIINGSFLYNQRAAANTVTAGGFRFDRWKGGASGCTASSATYGSGLQLTISAGSLIQVIENFSINGGNYVLSWVGTAQARVAVGGGAFTSYAASPMVVNSVSANTQVTIEFETGTLAEVQFEIGTTPTAFEFRPAPIELMLCKRYYQEVSFFWVGFIGTASEQTLDRQLLAVPMRATPSLNLISGSDTVRFPAAAKAPNATATSTHLIWSAATVGGNDTWNATYGLTAEL